MPVSLILNRSTWMLRKIHLGKGRHCAENPKIWVYVFYRIGPIQGAVSGVISVTYWVFNNIPIAMVSLYANRSSGKQQTAKSHWTQ